MNDLIKLFNQATQEHMPIQVLCKALHMQFHHVNAALRDGTLSDEQIVIATQAIEKWRWQSNKMNLFNQSA